MRVLLPIPPWWQHFKLSCGPVSKSEEGLGQRDRGFYMGMGVAPACCNTTSGKKKQSSERSRDLSKISGQNHRIVTWCVGPHVVVTSEGSWDLTMVSLGFFQLWAPPVLGVVRQGLGLPLSVCILGTVIHKPIAPPRASSLPCRKGLDAGLSCRIE